MKTDVPTTRCRVCALADSDAFAIDAVRYGRCRSCGTLQNQMTPQEYSDMDPGYDPGEYLFSRSEAEIRAFLKVDLLRERLARICREAGMDPQGKSYLDIGCGMGGYMLAARDLGMTVRGFEPSGNHGALATDVLKLAVERDYFSSAKVLPETFDVILMSHVIEHIYEPPAFVADLLAALKPSGMLVMITPNAASLVARLTGRRWPMLVPVDHVTMLTPDALPHLLPEGFTGRVTTFEFPYEFLTTCGSVAKSMLKGRGSGQATPSAAEKPRLIVQTSAKAKALRTALTIGSSPFHALAGALGRRAALQIVIHRAG